ncbi:MAG TPA: DUF4153 domain-containing protein [Longimicrobiales bacterium]|nr:DUF4153 domain-containing protein [Longimicrobiales bacterium]
MNRPSTLTGRARRYLVDAAHAFEHAPVEVTLSVLLAATFSYTVSSDAEPFQEWLEIAVVILLTGAIAFTATLVHALGAWSTRTRWIVTAAGAIVAALYGVLVLSIRLEAEAWRAAALVGAGALIILGAPGLADRPGATDRFRRVTGRLLLRTIAALLYGAALFAGLALALGAVNTLFELQLDSRIYAHTLGLVFFVLVPWVVVGGLPDYVRPEGDAGPVAAAVHRISAFLVTPLLTIYYIILYAYAVRIAITGELPQNLVSPLVIAAGLLAAIALTLFHEAERLRISAPLFVPMCLLGIWALIPRLVQYGWTEFRGFRMALLLTLGVLAILASVSMLRRRALRVQALPVALAAAAIISSVGPWSAIAASRRSQQARLAQGMTEAGIDPNATAVQDTLVPNEPYTQISETTRYLVSHFGADALPPLFAQHADSSERYVDVVYEAGLRPARPDLTEPRGVFTQLGHGALIPGTDTLYYVSAQGIDAGRRGAGEADDSIAADTTAMSRVRVTVGGAVLFADLRPLARELLQDPAYGRGMEPARPGAPPARVALRDEAGAVRGELIVLEFGAGGGVVHRLEGLVRMDR